MLEKDSWSTSPEGLFLDSGNSDLIREIASLACNDAKFSNNFLESNNVNSSATELCENVTFGNKGATSDSNLFQLGFDMSLTGSDLKFFANEEEGMDCTNLLYDGWRTDMDNFEDVDRMFSSCDSTYGQGNASYDNEFSWLSYALDGSEDVHVSSFNSSDSELRNTAKQSEGNLKFVCNSLTPSSTNFDKQNFLDASWMNSHQTSNADGHSYCNLVDTNVKDRRLSISNDQVSSFALHYALPMEKSSTFSPRVPSMMLEVDKVNQHQHLQPTSTVLPHHEDMVVKQAQAGPTDQVPVEEQLHLSLDGVERLSIEVPTGVDSSTIQENPYASTLLADASLEASSLRQLRHIMKQLDIRTKLCIRDSLYRLARSAEQRHDFGIPKSSGRDSRDEKGLLTTEEANVSLGFTDLEADTNRIDRSVAHLLFQSPSDPSIGLSDGSLSQESCSTNHGSITLVSI